MSVRRWRATMLIRGRGIRTGGGAGEMGLNKKGRGIMMK